MSAEKDKDKRSKKNETYRAIANFSQIGFTITANIFVGVLIGKYLDIWLSTSPWLLIIFSLLGVASAIRSLLISSNDKR